MLTLSCRPRAFTSYKPFLKKQKRGIGHRGIIFEESYFSCYIPNFIVSLTLLYETLGNICIATVC